MYIVFKYDAVLFLTVILFFIGVLTSTFFHFVKCPIMTIIIGYTVHRWGCDFKIPICTVGIVYNN